MKDEFYQYATSMPNNVPPPGEMVVPTAAPILALANIDTAPLCLSHHKYNTSSWNLQGLLNKTALATEIHHQCGKTYSVFILRHRTVPCLAFFICKHKFSKNHAYMHYNIRRTSQSDSI